MDKTRIPDEVAVVETLAFAEEAETRYDVGVVRQRVGEVYVRVVDGRCDGRPACRSDC